MRSVVVIEAGLREPSSTSMLGERLAESTRTAFDAAGEQVEITTVHLREYFPDIAQAFSSFAPSRLREVFETVAQADGVIVLTPLFNTSYSGLFKSFFDVLPEGTLAGTPVLMGATGGTPRHSLALDYAIRPMLSYLKAEVLPTAVFAATDDWGATDDDVRPLPDRIVQAGRQFAEALLGRAQRLRADEFEGVADFGEMLKSLGQA